MSAAGLPKGLVFVGQFDSIRPVLKNGGAEVEGMRRITVVVPGVGEDADDDVFEATYFLARSGESTRMAKSIDVLGGALLPGDSVALKVRMRMSKGTNGRDFVNWDAIRLVKLEAAPPAEPASVPSNGRRLTPGLSPVG